MKNVTKVIAIMLVTLMGFGVLSGDLFEIASAAEPTSSQDQISDQGRVKYFTKTGTEIIGPPPPSLGSNAVVSTEKKIMGTGTENEFLVTLDVKTSVDITDVKVSNDAAVVLVLDTSYSMITPVGGSTRIDLLKSSAKEFLDSYVEEAGDAKRYVSLVTFGSDAIINMSWIDINDSQSLAQMKDAINDIIPQGYTNMEGGLQLARNLLRKEALPRGLDGQPIESRSVLLFSDGDANAWTALVNGGTDHTPSVVNYSAGTKVFGGSQQYYPNEMNLVKAYTTVMSNSIKNQNSFIVNSVTYEKYDAALFTIAFGAEAPSDWLAGNIATNSSFAYTAATAKDLNDVFAAISKRIESWAKAWVVTDPMGSNMEFIQPISQNDMNTGLLKFTNNTLNWDLKAATPDSFVNNVYSYSYTYRLRLDTTSDTFKADTPYLANEATHLTYVMIVDGAIDSDVMNAHFYVPSVKGYSGNFGFTKVGDNTTKLAGCEFALANQTANKQDYILKAVSATNTGAVNFANIASGHNYKLSETSMPAELAQRYTKSDEVFTVDVAYGKVTIKNGQGDVVNDGFLFNNPGLGRTVTGLVWPLVTNDLGLGDEFLKMHGIVVELRTSFLTPAPANLSTTAVWSGVGDNGQFTIKDVPFGNYLLYIKRPGYLTRCMPVTVSENDLEVIFLKPPGSEGIFNLWWGDVNGDHVVDNLDILRILDCMEKQIDVEDPRYNPAYDLNADGNIDNLDILRILDKLNKEATDYEGAANINLWE